MKVFLIGMMGSGKSFWKKSLSEKLKTGGYDLDQVITSVEEQSIPEIFESEGETYFRKTESKLLRWFGEKKSFVLATGGGTPCFHQNMEWMNQQGLTIWLNESIEVLVERLSTEMDHRPLLNHLDSSHLTQFLKNQLEERLPFYSQSKIILTSKDIQLKSLLQKIKQNA